MNALRLDRGWTQADLAERTELSIQFISGLEQMKKNASIKTLDALASAFGVPTSALFVAGERPETKKSRASEDLLRAASAVPHGQEKHAVELLQVLGRAISEVTQRRASTVTTKRAPRRSKTRST